MVDKTNVHIFITDKNNQHNLYAMYRKSMIDKKNVHVYCILLNKNIQHNYALVNLLNKNIPPVGLK